MCGSLSVTGGLFLIVMNIYNYHMLEKERTIKDMNQNLKTTDDQGLVKVSEAHQAEMQQIPEAANNAEQIEPEAADENSAQGDPRPEDAETPCNV
ncbi:hypothetical protein LDENG_00044350 [Lucifuga dentata]|nr:hypothetical protein LDENG_00044350 [Lucifuga dentata]